MQERKPIISFRNANIINGEATVICDLHMDVFPGDFVYIVGKVGTGKTSIIRTIIAENPLETGEGEVCGFSLNGIKEKEIPFLRRQMGVVFQDFQLLMDRSVEDNLSFVLKATGWKNDDDIVKKIKFFRLDRCRIITYPCDEIIAEIFIDIICQIPIDHNVFVLEFQKESQLPKIKNSCLIREKTCIQNVMFHKIHLLSVYLKKHMIV
jgi:ABC-type sugar transport system ATPase subunit